MLTYATESAAYRAGQCIEDKINALIAEGMDEAQAKLKGVEQFAIECAIMKVHGSEALDYVVDESLQTYGGMGFSEEAPMARAYRDARITRIYEGTNEINRMLLVGMLLKRAMSGELDLLGPAMEVAKELTSVPSFAGFDASALFAEEKQVIKGLKKAVLMVAGKAAQTFGPALEEQQEIMMHVADMIIETYVAESALLRTEKLIGIRGQEACRQYINMARLYLNRAVDKVAYHGKEAINSFATGDEQRVMLTGLKRFTRMNPINATAIRRELADFVIAQNKYPF